MRHTQPVPHVTFSFQNFSPRLLTSFHAASVIVTDVQRVEFSIVAQKVLARYLDKGKPCPKASSRNSIHLMWWNHFNKKNKTNRFKRQHVKNTLVCQLENNTGPAETCTSMKGLLLSGGTAAYCLMWQHYFPQPSFKSLKMQPPPASDIHLAERVAIIPLRSRWGKKKTC